MFPEFRTKQQSLMIKDLCHGDYVRNDTLSLKTPIMASCATKSRLYFICNADTASLAYNVIDLFQISWD